MPMWRCPHCGTPQPEADRCWVCRRSSTCCATCRHYRRAVAAGLGYCGLDRQRRPLTGHEIRACWLPAGIGATVPGEDRSGAAGPSAPGQRRTGVRNRRDFEPVPVAAGAGPDGATEAGSTAGFASPGRATGSAAAVQDGPAAAGDAPSGWSLFPELDP